MNRDISELQAKNLVLKIYKINIFISQMMLFKRKDNNMVNFKISIKFHTANSRNIYK
jgi:hypothetical protein